jgi:hypothetical protein
MKRAKGLRMLVATAVMTFGIQGLACAGEERSVEAGPPSEATEEGKQEEAPPAEAKPSSESTEVEAKTEKEAQE